MPTTNNLRSGNVVVIRRRTRQWCVLLEHVADQCAGMAACRHALFVAAYAVHTRVNIRSLKLLVSLTFQFVRAAWSKSVRLQRELSTKKMTTFTATKQDKKSYWMCRRRQDNQQVNRARICHCFGCCIRSFF
jgi:hypothetical protein